MKNLDSQRRTVIPELPPAFDRRLRERIALKIPLRVLSYGLLMEKSDGTYDLAILSAMERGLSGGWYGRTGSVRG